MEKQLARPYYQDTGRRPYLYYAVIGIDGEAELEIFPLPAPCERGARRAGN